MRTLIKIEIEHLDDFDPSQLCELVDTVIALGLNDCQTAVEMDIDNPVLLLATTVQFGEATL